MWRTMFKQSTLSKQQKCGIHLWRDGRSLTVEKKVLQLRLSGVSDHPFPPSLCDQPEGSGRIPPAVPMQHPLSPATLLQPGHSAVARSLVLAPIWVVDSTAWSLFGFVQHVKTASAALFLHSKSQQDPSERWDTFIEQHFMYYVYIGTVHIPALKAERESMTLQAKVSK